MTFSLPDIISMILDVLKETAGGLRTVEEHLDIIVEANEKIHAKLTEQGHTIEPSQTRSLFADRVSEHAFERLLTTKSAKNA